jgi:hypothetical protein
MLLPTNRTSKGHDMSDTRDIFELATLDTWVAGLDREITRYGVSKGMASIRSLIRVMDGTDEAYNTIIEVWEAREDALNGMNRGCGVVDCDMC